jgi:hypothetical protein
MVASTRFFQRFGVFAFVVVVGTSAPTDTTKHVYGYGGVLPLPPAIGGEDGMAPTPDVLGQRHSTVRTEKGRVLYANERVSSPAGSEAHAATVVRAKRPCSQVVQSRTVATPSS